MSDHPFQLRPPGNSSQHGPHLDFSQPEPEAPEPSEAASETGQASETPSEGSENRPTASEEIPETPQVTSLDWFSSSARLNNYYAADLLGQEDEIPYSTFMTRLGAWRYGGGTISVDLHDPNRAVSLVATLALGPIATPNFLEPGPSSALAENPEDDIGLSQLFFQTGTQLFDGRLNFGLGIFSGIFGPVDQYVSTANASPTEYALAAALVNYKQPNLSLILFLAAPEGVGFPFFQETFQGLRGGAQVQIQASPEVLISSGGYIGQNIRPDEHQPEINQNHLAVLTDLSVNYHTQNPEGQAQLQWHANTSFRQDGENDRQFYAMTAVQGVFTLLPHLVLNTFGRAEVGYQFPTATALSHTMFRSAIGASLVMDREFLPNLLGWNIDSQLALPQITWDAHFEPSVGWDEPSNEATVYVPFITNIALGWNF